MTVYDNMKAGRYENTVEYPTRSHKPKLVSGATPAQIREYADAVEKWEANYDAKKTAYYAEQHARQALLKRDLEEEYGLTNHPKADMVWGKAWEHGHSGGYNDVATWYSEFAEVVQ